MDTGTLGLTRPRDVQGANPMVPGPGANRWYAGLRGKIDDQTRLAQSPGHFDRECGPFGGATPGQHQRAIRVSDVPFGPLLVHLGRRLLQWVLPGDPTVFSFPAFGAPPTAREPQLQGHILGRAVHSCLSAGDYFLNSRSRVARRCRNSV